MDVADRRDPTAGTSGPTPASRSDDEPALEERTRVLVCTPGGTLEIDDPAEAHKALADPEARAWIDLVDPSPEQVERIAKKLDLHPLIAEDILERNQRAKVEEIDGDLHIVIFDLHFDGEVKLTEVDIVLGERFLLTSHAASFEPLKLAQLRGGATPLLTRGHDYLLYAILDGIVDGYFPVLDQLSEDLDSLEDAVIETPTSWTLQRLFTLKRELMALRRATSPAREVLNQLTNRESNRIRPEHILYFRDVYDHLIRVADEVDNDRELVAGTLDVYLSTVNNNLSAIMKRLTGVTVILAGIGAVAGIFGMSEAGAVFDGAEHPGFWMVTAVIVVLAGITAVVLRRIDWI